MARQKRSLKTRLLTMVVGLILAVFLLIILVFNALISNYIETNATDVLTQSRGEVDRSRDPSPDREPRSLTPGGSAQRLIVTPDFVVLLPDFYPVLNESAADYDFIQAVQAGDVQLTSDQILPLQTDQGLYYYTAVANPRSDGTYLVYFINMTNLYSFEQDLFRYLWLIMAAALVLTVALVYFIAARFSGPIQTLNRFARRIGDGDYQVLDQDFADRELHELKTAMNESSQKLKTYDEEQRVFFQNASHELRTPLQIIKTNAEAVELGLIPQAKALPVIRQEVDSLGQLVEDIILLSRLDARSQDRAQTMGDLRETLAFTVERFATVLAESSIRVDYDFQAEPVLFYYDERSMERAFQNLIANASRYARSLIRVTCRIAGDRILIQVADDGTGISSQDLPRIFDRFYKGSKGNHGIGLAIVKSIVTAYGGRVEVASDPQGTEFSLFLPLPQEAGKSQG